MTEDVNLLAAVRAYQVAHILYDTDDRNIHQLCHLASLLDNHRNQILRRGHDDDAVHRNRLENSQRNIACARRHIDEHIVHLSPDYIAPELLNGSCNDRSSPDDRVVGVFQQQVNRHDLGALRGQARVDAQLGSLCASSDPKHLRDRWTGDVRIQNGGRKSSALHHNCQRRGDHRLANAAFAADDTDDLFNLTQVVCRLQQALWLGAGTLA